MSRSCGVYIYICDVCVVTALWRAAVTVKRNLFSQSEVQESVLSVRLRILT